MLVLYIDALTGNLVTGIAEAPENDNKPKSYSLEQNYPNPFNPEKVIKYQLPKKEEV